MKKFLLMSLVTLICFGGAVNAQTKKVVKKTQDKTVVEVLYFHSKQRCPTCIAIGDNSKDVVSKEIGRAHV